MLLYPHEIPADFLFTQSIRRSVAIMLRQRPDCLEIDLLRPVGMTG